MNRELGVAFVFVAIAAILIEVMLSINHLQATPWGYITLPVCVGLFVLIYSRNRKVRR
jgi:hypothetical protein